MWITFHYEFDVRAAWPAAPADPANLTVAEAEQAIIIPLPGANASTGWAPVSVGWVCTNAGTVAGSFGLRYGAWNAAGTIWVSAGTIVSSQSITTTGADDTGVHSVATPTTTVITPSATVRGLVLQSAGAGTGVMDAANEYLAVTLSLRRQIQA